MPDLLVQRTEYERNGTTYAVEIHYDPHAGSPRDDTNLCTISAWASRYDLTDDDAPDYRSTFEEYGFEPIAAELDDDPSILWWAPLRVEDHGARGVNLSLAVDGERAHGVVFVTREDWKACMGNESVRSPEWFASPQGVQGELDTYADYCNGNVYGYIVKVVETHRDANGEPFTHDRIIEDGSCWGFIGDDGRDECEREALEAVEYDASKREKVQA